MNSSPEGPRYGGGADGSEHGAEPGRDADRPDRARSRPPLRRPASGRLLAGVAAGIAQHFSIDVTIVRVGFAVLTIVGFTGLAYFAAIPLYLGGIPLYLACWLLIPEEGSDQSIVGRLLAARQHRPG
ncbi:MAG TPA: PspC domain-containing protein [Streptosporangiaceae bacterium]|nr:PspC domain-containing protein [Streptosporangiaceae bacterium]